MPAKLLNLNLKFFIPHQCQWKVIENESRILLHSLAKYLICIVQFYISENGYGLIVQVARKHAFDIVLKINDP